MDALIHAANVVRLCSFFQKDTVRLRLLTAIGALCLLAYFAAQDESMPAVIAWNAFFVAVNLVQVLQELVRRRAAEHLIAASDASAESSQRDPPGEALLPAGTPPQAGSS